MHFAPCLAGRVGKDIVSRVRRKVKSDWDAWNTRSLVDEPIVRLILDVGSVQPGAFHRDLGLAELPVNVRIRLPCRWPVTTAVNIATLRMARLAGHSGARQNGVKLAANHLLDQFANPPRIRSRSDQTNRQKGGSYSRSSNAKAQASW